MKKIRFLVIGLLIATMVLTACTQTAVEEPEVEEPEEEEVVEEAPKIALVPALSLIHISEPTRPY